MSPYNKKHWSHQHPKEETRRFIYTSSASLVRYTYPVGPLGTPGPVREEHYVKSDLTNELLIVEDVEKN